MNPKDLDIVFRPLLQWFFQKDSARHDPSMAARKAGTSVPQMSERALALLSKCDVQDFKLWLISRTIYKMALEISARASAQTPDEFFVEFIGQQNLPYKESLCFQGDSNVKDEYNGVFERIETFFLSVSAEVDVSEQHFQSVLSSEEAEQRGQGEETVESGGSTDKSVDTDTPSEPYGQPEKGSDISESSGPVMMGAGVGISVANESLTPGGGTFPSMKDDGGMKR